MANEAIKALPKYIFIYIFGKLLLIMAATIKARQVAHTRTRTHPLEMRVCVWKGALYTNYSNTI